MPDARSRPDRRGGGQLRAARRLRRPLRPALRERAMTFDYTPRGRRHAPAFSSISAGRWCAPSGSERRAMTVNGWIQILLFCAVVAALAKPLGAYLTRVLDGDLPGIGADRAPALPPRRRRSARGAELARLRAGAARLQPRGRPRCSTRSSGCRAGCRSTRPAWPRCRRSSPSTPPSPSSPTPTGRTTAARRR